MKADADEDDQAQLRAAVKSSPAAERNKAPLLEQLRARLPREGIVLEIASGTGQHVEHFAAALPHLVWQPSDPDAELRGSIRARIELAGLGNAREPLDLDVLADSWPRVEAAAILCANMIHIAPWAATEGLFRHAATLLEPGAELILYGPFKHDGRHTADSNAAFDRSLKTRDPDWGVRDLADVDKIAAARGFARRETAAMPANNLVVVYALAPDGQ